MSEILDEGLRQLDPRGPLKMGDKKLISLYWVAVKEVQLRYCNMESLSFTTYGTFSVP